MAAIDRGVDPDSAADGVAVKRRCQGHGRMHGGPSPVTPKGNKNALKHGRSFGVPLQFSPAQPRFGSPKFERLGAFQRVIYKHRAVGAAMAVGC
jgi:hypothetical protein